MICKKVPSSNIKIAADGFEKKYQILQDIYDSIKRMDEMAEIRSRLTIREAQMSQEKIRKGDVKS